LGSKSSVFVSAKRSPRQGGFADTKTLLFDLQNDPEQNHSFQDQELENDLCEKIMLEMVVLPPKSGPPASMGN